MRFFLSLVVLAALAAIPSAQVRDSSTWRAGSSVVSVDVGYVNGSLLIQGVTQHGMTNVAPATASPGSSEDHPAADTSGTFTDGVDTFKVKENAEGNGIVCRWRNGKWQPMRRRFGGGICDWGGNSQTIVLQPGDHAPFPGWLLPLNGTRPLWLDEGDTAITAGTLVPGDEIDSIPTPT